ncbi:hypothetical protein ILUMI_26394 [Ignelater luminosus]|uniref:Uncharacterized protein n=1 Tax=Ignelater luminosus TaxID=2038154 RepID=A0A8K0FXE3_IGNLU|nr:hypothetical protein ILUMI_26394 [Ignelater luminosus]
MRIGRIDVTETKRLQKREVKKNKHLSRLVTSDGSIVCDSVTNTEIEKTDTPLATPESKPSFTLESSLEVELSISNCQMRISLPTVARICDQFGVFDRSAAAIATAVLQDVGITTKEEKKLDINKSRI